MGAAGLALAGSIGGWVLFVLTLKEVGFSHVIKPLFSRHILLLLLAWVTLGALSYYGNTELMAIIRR